MASSLIGGCSVRLEGHWPQGAAPLVSSYYCLLASAARDERLARVLRLVALDIYAVASPLHGLVSVPVKGSRLEALLPVGCSVTRAEVGRGGVRLEAECGRGGVSVVVECSQT